MLLKRAEMCFYLFQLLGNTSLFNAMYKSASFHFLLSLKIELACKRMWTFPESLRFHTLLQLPTSLSPTVLGICLPLSPGKAANRDARTTVRMRAPPECRGRSSTQARWPRRGFGGGAGLRRRLSFPPRLWRRHLGRAAGA